MTASGRRLTAASHSQENACITPAAKSCAGVLPSLTRSYPLRLRGNCMTPHPRTCRVEGKARIPRSTEAAGVGAASKAAADWRISGVHRRVRGVACSLAACIGGRHCADPAAVGVRANAQRKDSGSPRCKRGVAEPEVRPREERVCLRDYATDAANAIRTFITIPDVNLGLWTGVQTAAQETAILSFLAKAGIAKSTFVIVLQALNCCGRKGKGSFFPGTTKRVYVKPVALVETLLPGYKPYLLVDNDLQKSEGLGPIDNRRLANTFLQHLEVHPFRGLPGDKCLDPSGGCCWLAPQKRLAQLHDAP